MPEDWSRIQSWLDFKGPLPKISDSHPDPIKIKNPEVPVLSDVSKFPGKEFWDKFPSNCSVSDEISSINTAVLRKKLEEVRHRLTNAQYRRGLKAVKFVDFGAPSYQKSDLPPCHVKNVQSAKKNSTLVTDSIATWVKKGFVRGPFDYPPLPRFRSNCLMAIEQHEKLRLVLNVSLPENQSFNSNIEDVKLEKVRMSSARLFGYSVKKCGRNAVFSKFDLCDAYKNVKCPTTDYRLQGFEWLGKFFFENRQIFGARSSVTNFDIVGNTIQCIAICLCTILSELVHRQLDDVPVVSPANKNWCKEFSDCYSSLCKQLNIQIASDCPKFEKAFSNVTAGKVLGIWFDSSDLSWSLPKEKKDRAIAAICKSLTEEVDLLSMQKLVGRLNDISLMCPFLLGFKRPIIDDLRTLQNEKLDAIRISEQSKKDLLVWLGFLTDPLDALPIPREPSGPTVTRKSFISDAAGQAANCHAKTGPGVASVGFDENGKFIFAQRITWPIDMISKCIDGKGVRMGDKSTTLEMIGLLLPWLSMPKKLKNQHVVFEVDNIACVHGWENRSLKGEIMASIIIRSILLISSFLGSSVHVFHVPRKSNWESLVVDRMSRLDTMNSFDQDLLKSFSYMSPGPVLLDWVENPSEDWDLSISLLDYVKKICD